MLLFAGAVLLTGLSPGYYFARLGVVSPLMAGGFSNWTDITLKRVVSIFLDPDIGLYPNWPFGFLVVLAGAAVLVRRNVIAALSRSFRRKPCLFVFIGSFLLLEPLAHASQINVNGGGTVHLSRYATWYIPLHYPVLRGLLRRAARAWSGASPLRRWAAGVAVALLAAPVLWFNVADFTPQRPEVYSQDSPAARFVYGHIPAVFDPLPEVFLSRTGEPPIEYVPRGEHRMNPRQIRAGGSALFDQGIWAYGVPSCRKLFVIAGMLRLVQGDALRRPSGCIVQVDAARLLLRAREHGGDRDFYLNLSAADLDSGYP